MRWTLVRQGLVMALTLGVLITSAMDAVLSATEPRASALTAGNTWAQLTPTGEPPAARHEQVAVWHSGNNQLLVFGGVASTSTSGGLVPRSFAPEDFFLATVYHEWFIVENP